MGDVALLIYNQDLPEGTSAGTVFGGVPSVRVGFIWPACHECGMSMLFLGQLRPEGDEQLTLLFMCENDHSACETWDPESGANAVFHTGVETLGFAEVPTGNKVLRDTRYGARIEQVAAADYDNARELWGRRNPGKGRHVLGQLGGVPSWLQADETPKCERCLTPMRFVAQLETGPDARTAMNFAGGCGYVFECRCAGRRGKFLWQS